MRYIHVYKLTLTYLLCYAVVSRLFDFLMDVVTYNLLLSLFERCQNITEASGRNCIPYSSVPPIFLLGLPVKNIV